MNGATGHHDEIELYSHLTGVHFPDTYNIVMRQLTLEQLGRFHDELHTPNQSLGHHISDLSVSRVTEDN